MQSYKIRFCTDKNTNKNEKSNTEKREKYDDFFNMTQKIQRVSKEKLL